MTVIIFSANAEMIVMATIPSIKYIIVKVEIIYINILDLYIVVW